uniref:Uncharacterized protein n=1 Tax=Aegilops tauschii TaxID=37682 RepID=M8BU63_AEGTA
MSRLKAQQMAQTCVLSTRWRHLWRAVPCLDVDEQEELGAGRNFRNFVTNLLGGHDVALLEEFRVHALMTADPWVRHAIGQDGGWPCRLKSPAAIRSALMTTAYTVYSDGTGILDVFTGRPTNPMDMGANHVDPSKAIDPSLMYNITSADYLDFLCTINYSGEHIKVAGARREERSSRRAHGDRAATTVASRDDRAKVGPAAGDGDEQLDNREEPGGGSCWWRAEEEGPAAGDGDEQLDDREEPGGGSGWWRAEEEEEDGLAAGLDEQLEERRGLLLAWMRCPGGRQRAREVTYNGAKVCVHQQKILFPPNIT